jgi:protein-disulfide isomerase
MTKTDVSRIAVPLVLATVILLSFPRKHPPQPVELEPGQAPVPSAAQTRGAFERALAPGSPGYDRGATRAPVTVIEFADFGCRYCASFALQTYPELAAEFVKTGKVRWKYVPFAIGIFANGDAAAFDAMHDRLYRRQNEWAGARDPAALFGSYAEAGGLDTARFASCYRRDEPAQRIRASNELADRIGVRATPTFVVDGYRVEGALPLEQFRAVLLDALRRSQ